MAFVPSQQRQQGQVSAKRKARNGQQQLTTVMQMWMRDPGSVLVGWSWLSLPLLQAHGIVHLWEEDGKEETLLAITEEDMDGTGHRTWRIRRLSMSKKVPVMVQLWLSPLLQLVRSNSRRFMPSQADEEAHQLSYLQKHMANVLTLLADSVDGDGDESMVLTMETFEHLGFLLQFSEGTPLSQAAPFFANSDPDMPAAPVPATQVHDWILQNIASSLEYTAEKSITKENNQRSVSDPDVAMADAVTNTRIQSSSPTGASVQNNPGYYRNTSFVEGISKTSVVKHGSDIKGHSIKVLNCHDSVIYILAPLKYATVYGCSDITVVLGAIGKVVKVEHCERVQIVAASKRICIANCRECIFYLGVNHQPLIVGDNHKLQVAPFNTYYPQLGEHLAQVGVDPNVNKWDQPFVLGVVDPHDSLSHPAGVSDVQAESATCLDPDLFTDFMIPSWFEAEGPTKYNPFTLPEVYWASQRKKNASLEDIQKNIRELELDDNRKKELACALHAQFKDWLYASGNIRQLYCLQGE